MTVTYRGATSADLPAIDDLFRTSFCDTFAHLYQPEDLAEFLGKFTADAWAEEFNDPRYRFRIAELDGKVVGFVKLGPSTLPIDTSRRAIELRQIYVGKDYHGSGIAKALTDWAIDQARSQGFEELYLTVYTDNHRAKRFYDRYGFQAIRPYAFMVGSQADEDIIMRKTL
jgi:ribosomal protein S18 acetylase RimI-like enzyme